MEHTPVHAGAAYLDAATAVPLHPLAREAMLAALADGWADPDRPYGAARRAARLRDAARASMAESLGVRPDETIFTSSGTAAAHAAVLGGLAGRRRAGRTLVHSAIEHSAVLHAAARHAEAGPTSAGDPMSQPAAATSAADPISQPVAATSAADPKTRPTAETGGDERPRAISVGVDRLGRLDLDAWRAAVSAPGVALAALISASHEVGTVQPVAAAAEACAAAGVPLYVDAAQSVGRMPVPPGWSILTASARKWGGPPGVGVLVLRKGTRWLSPYPGDDPYRPQSIGAPDLPAIVGAAAGLRAVLAEAKAEADRQAGLIDRIRETVARTVPDVEVVGDPVDRLPNLVTFSCLYVDGEALLHALDRRGFAVSSGSSCTASTLRPSHVLEAMGVLSHGNVRVSLHPGTTEEEVDRFLAELPGVVAAIRAEAGM